MPTSRASTLVAAIDQGTTSSRTLIVSADGEVVAQAAKEHRQICPAPGYVEHDGMEILSAVAETFHAACRAAGVRADEVAGIGITNQRETTLLWDRATGRPVHNAIVWQDTRTRELCRELGGDVGPDRLRETTGLPLATYFAGPKLAWLLERVPGARRAAEGGELAFGTVESFLAWHLCGPGVHVSDVANASRTMLMGLRSLDWDDAALRLMNIPRGVLPKVVPNTPVGGVPFGVTSRDGPLGAEIPVVALVGDQQASMIGQACLSAGDLKNTYGTGCFLLLHTGNWPVKSAHGLLTTVAYRFGEQAPCYALEGSIAVAGSLVQWLRDNLGLIAASDDIEGLAASVPDTGGVAFVPAFSGLFAPWWDASARGAVLGLTRHSTRAHVARAALESTALQTADVLDAMRSDGAAPAVLKADGGMTRNALLMQMQSDLTGLAVTTAARVESTALGAAYAALLALGVVGSPGEIARLYRPARTFTPALSAEGRQAARATWMKALEKSKGWLS